MTAMFDAIVIGASAGAVESLSALLPTLPADYTIPILVVVHVPPDRKSVLANLMQEKCKVPVREAEDKEPIDAGTIYFAPPDYHMLIETNGVISLSVEDPVLFSRPSIDVLFESAADVYGSRLAGIILTGANADGANGLKAIADVGGVSVVQNPAQAYAPFMPAAALKSCPEANVMGLSEIADFLQKGVV